MMSSVCILIDSNVHRYAIFRGCNMKGANLSYCNFERADFTGAVLDGALFLGVRMLCANMEKASLQKCTFDDPAGYLANMEGKGATKFFDKETTLVADDKLDRLKYLEFFSCKAHATSLFIRGW